MKFLEISLDQYDEVFGRYVEVFGAVPYFRLHAGAVDDMKAVGVVDAKGKLKMGAVFGIKDDKALLPWRAPFGTVACRGGWSCRAAEAFADGLSQVFAGREVCMTLAPMHYDQSGIGTVVSAMVGRGAKMSVDADYWYDLTSNDSYESRLDASARGRWRQASRQGFVLEKCSVERAYAVIAANRHEHGYPLAMSMEAVSEMCRLVEVDCFVLSLNGKDAAAAILYRFKKSSTAYLVYWGNLGWSADYRPMLLLPQLLFEYYRQLGFEKFDLGTASTDGVVNIGLASFKESLGCELSLKPTLTLDCR